MNGEQRPRVPDTQDVPAKPMPNLEEVMDLNKLWKQEYDLLQKQFEHEKGKFQEDNNRLKQEVRNSELRCAKLETKNFTLQSELIRLARAFEITHPQQKCTSNEAGKDLEDVELIKEQLDVYKEDFKLEHKDKEKIQSEKQSLQQKLLQCEKHVHTLRKELELYKQECKRLHEERSRPKLKHHASVDRSNSYPSTTDSPFETVSNGVVHHCIGANKDGYLSLDDFRHEQYKRGILVRNPTQSKSQSSVHLQVNRTPPRRLSDSDSTNKLHGNTSRTSCLW